MPDNNAPTPWFKTSHSVLAMNTEHARKKVRKMFGAAGFHSMSLVAVPFGTNPNIR